MTTSVPKFVCKLCNQEYISKLNFNQHVSYCEWIHSTLQSRNQHMDQCEKRLTDVQRDKLIRELITRMNTLEQQTETKMKRMQNEINLLKRTRRMRIIEWLNKHVQPTITWKQWLAAIPLHATHLELALKYSVYECIRMCLEEYLNTNKPSLTEQARPMCAFKQRRDFMYVYDEVIDISKSETTFAWKLIDRKEFNRPLSKMVFRLQNMYIQWRMDNLNHICQSEDNQDEDRRNSHKMMTATNVSNMQINTVFRAVHELINQDLEETIIEETTTTTTTTDPQHELCTEFTT